jgi:hypothetical protein
MDSTALIAPMGSGGATYVVEKLWEGLRREIPVNEYDLSLLSRRWGERGTPPELPTYMFVRFSYLILS